MVNPAVAQQIKIFLICGIALLLAVFLGIEIGAEHYPRLAIGAVVVGMAAFTVFSGRFFWIFTIASSFLGGTFPILKGQFTPFQILMAVGVAKFFIGDVVLRRTKLKFGPRFDTALIMCFMTVLFWHGVHDRFGMKFLGSSVWGGRHYVNVFVGLVAFAVIQSLPIPLKLWSKLPYTILAVTTFDLLIGVITAIFPASIYKIYPFYSAVSMAGIEEISVGESLTGRIVAFGGFGFVLILLVFSSVRVGSILHPSNFRRLVMLGLGWAAVLYSGFRTFVFNSFFATMVAGVRDLKGRVVVLIFLLAFFLAGVSFINSEVVRLPKQIQRSLTFIPGKWDPAMVQDANASNDFRRTVWDLFVRQYFPVHPLLGRGFGFRAEWTQTSIYNPRAIDFQQMVETGNIHNGFLASLDTWGIIGTLFFVVWCLRLLRQTFGVPFLRKDPPSIALRIVALYLAVSVLSFWLSANSIGSFLPQIFALAGVFFRLREDVGIEQKPAAASTPIAERAAPRRLAPR